MGAGSSRTTQIASPLGLPAENERIGADFYEEDLSAFPSEYVERIYEDGVEGGFENIVHHFGLDTLPVTVNEEDFRKYVDSGELIELSRGISAGDQETAEAYEDALKNGDFYVAGGEAYYGNGMYTFGPQSLYMAVNYAGNHSGRIIHMGLRKDAKILEINENSKPPKLNERLENFVSIIERPNLGGQGLKYLRDRGADISKIESMKPDMGMLSSGNAGGYLMQDEKYKTAIKNSAIREMRKELSSDDMTQIAHRVRGEGWGNGLAAAMGYDAIRYSPEAVAQSNGRLGHSEVVIVLNRGKLVIQDNSESPTDYFSKKEIS